MKWRKAAFVLTGVIACTGLAAKSSRAEWQEENGKWWYANLSEKGYSTGWEEIDGKWFLFDEEGWMLTGWQQDNHSWYYLDSSGEMKTGWILLDGWYYLEPSGAMRTDDLTEDHRIYYFSDNGICTNPEGEVIQTGTTAPIGKPLENSSWIVKEDNSNLTFLDQTNYTWTFDDKNYNSGTYQVWIGEIAIEQLLEDFKSDVRKEEFLQIFYDYGARSQYHLENFMYITMTNKSYVVDGEEQSANQKQSYYLGISEPDDNILYIYNLLSGGDYTLIQEE